MTAMTDKKTAAEALRQAAQQHRAAVEAAAKISAALERARQNQPEAGPSLEDLMREQRTLEAAIALGEVEPAEADRQRKAIASQRRDAEKCTEQRQRDASLIDGLEERQRAAAAAVVAGLDAMTAAEAAYRRAVFEEADADYLAAALALGVAYRRARAALGLDRLLSSRQPSAFSLGGAATRATPWGSDPTINLIDCDLKGEHDALLAEIGALTSASPVKPGFLERARRIALGERVEVA